MITDDLDELETTLRARAAEAGAHREPPVLSARLGLNLLREIRRLQRREAALVEHAWRKHGCDEVAAG